MKDLFFESKGWRRRFFWATMAWIPILIVTSIVLFASMISPDWELAVEVMRAVMVTWGVVVVICSVKWSLTDRQISDAEYWEFTKRGVEIEIILRSKKPEEGRK